MQVPSNQIVEKEVVGKCASNNMPVYLVRLIGGLIMVLTYSNGEYKVVGAAPHRGVAMWLAEQKCPGVIWDRSRI